MRSLRHHPPFPLIEAAHAICQHAAWLRASRFRPLSGEMALSNSDRKLETEEGTTGKPRHHRLFTEAIQTLDSGGVGNEKKRKMILKKAESKKNKSGILPKSGRLTSLKLMILTMTLRGTALKFTNDSYGYE